MNINFRKFLPVKMRNTLWGEFIDVFQSLWADLKSEKINRIFNQFDINTSTKEEKLEIAKTLGFNLLTLDGYTSSSDFINKEIATIVPRIQYKNSIPAYTYTGYCFNLLPNLYAVSATDTGGLTTSRLSTIYDPGAQIVLATTELDQEGDNILYSVAYSPWELDFLTGEAFEFTMDDDAGVSTFDSDWILYGDPKTTGKLETSLDSEDFITLDASTGTETGGGSSIITQITRNLNFNYKHKFVENTTEFMSLPTLKVLKNDVDQIHKATEVIYYAPVLDVPIKADKTQTTKTYTTYDLSLSANQESILIGNSLTDILYVEFGTGSRTVISGILSGVNSGVQNFSYRYPDVNISGLIPSGVINYFNNAPSGYTNFDFNIEERNQFSGFTEIAIYNNSSGLILYSTFPKIQWDDNMYNNVQFQIQYV